MTKKVTEGHLGDMAHAVERDHEVQMARADLYKIAKYAIKLHDMLKSVSEAEGIEGWQQAKITKAADYVGSVYHAMDYDTKFANEAVAEAKRSSYKDGLSAMLETKKKVDNCSKCGNPSYTTLDEEKKKGSHGKVCWKGYRRGKGDSCHRVKGDA